MRRLPPVVSAAVHATFGLLWIAGVAVFVLKYYFESKDVIGPHPWQPPLTEVHGILAVAATFLFGWIVADYRSQPQRHWVSGSLLIASLAWLVVTGFAQFFLVSDEWRGVASELHEYLGLVFLLPWLVFLTWGPRATA